jgi:hypothetical protein
MSAIDDTFMVHPPSSMCPSIDGQDPISNGLDIDNLEKGLDKVEEKEP